MCKGCLQCVTSRIKQLNNHNKCHCFVSSCWRITTQVVSHALNGLIDLNEQCNKNTYNKWNFTNIL